MWGVVDSKYSMEGQYFQHSTIGPVKWPHICWPYLKSCRTLTGPNDSYEMAAHTMTDPPPCLTPGKRHCGLNALFGVLQTETGPERKQRQFINLYYFYLAMDLCPYTTLCIFWRLHCFKINGKNVF